MHIWRQHLQQQHHLLRVRRSILASPPSSMPPTSPSKFNFLPNANVTSSGPFQHRLNPFSMPELLQVKLCNNIRNDANLFCACYVMAFFFYLRRFLFKAAACLTRRRS